SLLLLPAATPGGTSVRLRVADGDGDPGRDRALRDGGSGDSTSPLGRVAHPGWTFVIMGVTHRRRVVLVSLLVGLVVTLDPRPEIAGAPQAARGVVPLGTIQGAGTVCHLRLDDAGRRLALSTVRYPENELQRNELSLYTLPASGTLAERPVLALTRDIDDAEAMALSPDGDWLAVACGSDVCLHGWGAAGTERRLVGVGRRRELGALALRPDAKLLVAAQRNRMEVLVWDLPDGPRRPWGGARRGAEPDGGAVGGSARRPAPRVGGRQRRRASTRVGHAPIARPAAVDAALG